MKFTIEIGSLQAEAAIYSLSNPNYRSLIRPGEPSKYELSDRSIVMSINRANLIKTSCGYAEAGLHIQQSVLISNMPSQSLEFKETDCCEMASLMKRCEHSCSSASAHAY